MMVAKRWMLAVIVCGGVGLASMAIAQDPPPDPSLSSREEGTSASRSSEGKTSSQPVQVRSFPKRLFDAYVAEFKGEVPPAPDQPRRALPSPWDAPPYPMSEYQGYPLVGVPKSTKEYPLMKALTGTSIGNALKAADIKAYGWFNGSYNRSTATNSNMPTSYMIVPNQFVMNQTVFRLEREVDSVQTDHIDFGFRATALYGIDYRYMTAGGWFSDQLLKHNQLYGFDPTEFYADTYIPWIAQGLTLRIGRWIACPDIETQFAVDNYLASHSLLFTHDTYTQTGAMATVMLNPQWTVQAAIHAGTDMAPWYKGAVATGMFGVRWVAKDNNDSVYLVLNNINGARFRHFNENGLPSGHDNFNYVVGTWQHRFTKEVHTKTEAYYMWQYDAVVGGSANWGPLRPFGGGGGIGQTLPGESLAYGVVNYTMFQTSPRDYITVRNEWWRDERGMRAGFAGHYTSNTIGWSHQLNDVVMIRPEVGFYRNNTRPAFDLGADQNLLMAAVDMTVRF